MLAEEQASARAAAEAAASMLLDVEQAAAEDRKNLQQQLALLEQKLSEDSAIQDDLATRLQVSFTKYQSHWARASQCTSEPCQRWILECVGPKSLPSHRKPCLL